MIQDYKLKDDSMAAHPSAWSREGQDLIASTGDSRAVAVSCVGGTPFGFGCKVLCGAYWPTQSPAKDLPPPAPMQAAIDHHMAAYMQAHKDNRKLEYSMQEGTAELSFRPKSDSRLYVVNTSTVQCAAILTVQDLQAQGKTPTIGSLTAALKLTIPVLKRVLDPMLIPGKCGPKVPPLLKVNIKKDPAIKKARVTAGGLHPEDSVVVNTGFSARSAKITVPVLSLNINAKPKAAENRTHVIDACLVRVMKSRKALDVQELISEAVKQIRMFDLDVRQCRQRIDYLIDKEYFERDEDDSRKLTYLA